MVPAPSHWVSRVPWYSGFPPQSLSLRLRGFHLLWPPFPGPFGWLPSCLCGSLPRHAAHPGLGSFPFARRYSGNRFFFLLLRLLRCFSSPGSLPHTIMPMALFMYGCMRVPHAGFPIQTPMALWIFAPPHGFSQLIASFFGSQCQGILPVLFSAWPPSRIALRKGAVFLSFFRIQNGCGLGCLSYLF